jgi:hypothetical protein
MSEILVGHFKSSIGLLFDLTTASTADLREHALLALNSILKGNFENQEVVRGLDPVGNWDSEGVPRDRLGSTRRYPLS